MFQRALSQHNTHPAAVQSLVEEILLKDAEGDIVVSVFVDKLA